MTLLVISVDVEHINLWRCDVYILSSVASRSKHFTFALYFLHKKEAEPNEKLWYRSNCCHLQMFPFCIISPKINFEFTPLSSDVDFYSVVSDKKAEKEELSPPNPSINRHSVINIVEESILQE